MITPLGTGTTADVFHAVRNLSEHNDAFISFVTLEVMLTFFFFFFSML